MKCQSFCLLRPSPLPFITVGFALNFRWLLTIFRVTVLTPPFFLNHPLKLIPGIPSKWVPRHLSGQSSLTNAETGRFVSESTLPELGGRLLERGFCHHQPAHPEFKAGKVGGTVFVLISERRRWLCLVIAFLIRLNKQMFHFGSFLIEGKKKKGNL